MTVEADIKCLLQDNSQMYKTTLSIELLSKQLPLILILRIICDYLSELKRVKRTHLIILIDIHNWSSVQKQRDEHLH